VGKKSNKRTQPRDAENSLTRWFPWRGPAGWGVLVMGVGIIARMALRLGAGINNSN
jgi:hypothetical protein